MRIIPVMDLLNNRTVHAVKGEREQYKPVKSILSDSSDPIKIARAFRNNLGLNEIYIADLDAIRASYPSNHHTIIENLVSEEKFDLLLDAGVSDTADICRLLELGVRKVVVGSETLKNLKVLKDIPAETDRERLVFSLDCRAEKIISKCPQMAALSPLEALDYLRSSGWREIILLDLGRVGMGFGTNRSLAAEVRSIFPGLTLLLGGGITGPEEIKALQSMGIEGVLVATALHRGVIGPQHLARISRKGS